MNTKRFKIGDYVLVHATISSDHTGDDGKTKVITKNTFAEPKAGQVIGISRRQEGTIENETYIPYTYSCECDGLPDDGQPYLAVSKTIPVWLVRFGMINKEILVTDEDIEPNKNGKPINYRENNCPWSDNDKKELSKIMQDVPRDIKGRWLAPNNAVDKESIVEGIV